MDRNTDLMETLIWVNGSWLGMSLFFNQNESAVELVCALIYVELQEQFLLYFIFENLWWGNLYFDADCGLDVD